MAYQKGLSNKQIADIILNLSNRTLCIADSAEPKSIDEIKMYGVMIMPSEKGQGSVQQGIQFVQNQRISVTKSSLNLIKGYRNYMWKTDRDGKILNEPDHTWSDGMDAIRYAISSFRKNLNTMPIIPYNPNKWSIG